ncbi:MAG: alpha/beta fold hydrolase [Pseudomonadota bacterium]|nr:alpha/beta fold hydrolase [Pseudomonadota bacterium]
MPRARANGIELEYDSFGSGEPIVLVMGIATQMIFWDVAFCEALAARGFRVIRFDNRDIGLSTRLTDAGIPDVPRLLARALVGLPVTAPYTLSDMGADVVGLLDALSIERAHVVGMSMGGMIAQHVAIDAPARVASLTSIMSSPGGRRHWIGQPRALSALLGGRPKSREEGVEFLVEVLRVLNGPALPFPEPDVRVRVTEAVARSWHPAGFPRQFAAILASGNRTAALAKLRVPTLVVHGAADPLIPVAAGVATARAIPGAALHIVPGMGHSFPPAVWAEVTDAIVELAQGAGRAIR